jgi:acyl carrier protein
MDRTKIVAAIETALSEVLEREISGLTEEQRLFDDLHLDSTSVLELLMLVEDGTGISVDPEDLNIDHLQSVGSFADYVEARL